MKNFKRIFHGIGALALSAVLLLGAGQTAKAAADSPSLDLSKTGSVTVELKNTSGGNVTDGTLTIYEVAELGYGGDGGGDMTYYFTDAFEGCGVGLENVTQDSTELASIAGTLASYVTSKGITGTPMTNTTGTVTFDGLELGLYLVVQTTASSGYETISPFVVTVPYADAENDMWVYEVDASPKMGTLTAVPETPQEETPEETPEEEDPGEKVVETVTETLVQTGQLNWPIPVLTVAGLVMILFGAILMKTDNRRRVRR